MPQKRNPKLCQDIIAAGAEVRAMVPLALEAMQTEHEADRTTSLMMDSAEARACIETGDMLARLGEVMRGLRLDPARMRRNLDLGGGLIMAEAVMLELGAAIGRQHAHDVVYDAAQAAATGGKSFGDLLAADRRVTAHLDAGAIGGFPCRGRTPGCARRWRARRRSGRGRRSRPSLLENPRRRRISGFRSAASASMPRRKQMEGRSQWLAWTSWPPPSAAPTPRFSASNMPAGQPTRIPSIRPSPSCSAR
jgi:hypothetical protein